MVNPIFWPQNDIFTAEDYRHVEFVEQVYKLHLGICLLAMESLLMEVCTAADRETYAYWIVAPHSSGGGLKNDD